MPALIPTDLTGLIPLVTNSLTSAHSRRAYARAVREYLTWHRAEGWPRFARASVQAWKAHRLTRGDASATLNQALSAVKSLAREAAEQGLLDHLEAAAIERVPGVARHGVRAGNWLDQDTAQRLIDTPDTTGLRGLRDRAVLVLLLACGLRRDEAATLCVQDIQQRDGRLVVVDLIGKGKRVRSVPIPLFAAEILDEWASAAGLETGRLLRPIRGGRIDGDRISGQALREIVCRYAGELGVALAPHDLRRTFAALALDGGAEMRSIQAALGHTSIATTEKYLQAIQELREPACDHLGLKKGKRR